MPFERADSGRKHARQMVEQIKHSNNVRDNDRYDTHIYVYIQLTCTKPAMSHHIWFISLPRNAIKYQSDVIMTPVQVLNYLVGSLLLLLQSKSVSGKLTIVITTNKFVHFKDDNESTMFTKINDKRINNAVKKKQQGVR